MALLSSKTESKGKMISDLILQCNLLNDGSATYLGYTQALLLSRPLIFVYVILRIFGFFVEGSP